MTRELTVPSLLNIEETRRCFVILLYSLSRPFYDFLRVEVVKWIPVGTTSESLNLNDGLDVRIHKNLNEESLLTYKISK